MAGATASDRLSKASSLGTGGSGSRPLLPPRPLSVVMGARGCVLVQPLYSECVTLDSSSSGTQFFHLKSRDNSELKESKRIFVTQGPCIKINDN